MTCPRCQMANVPGALACAGCGFALRGGRASGGVSSGLAIASMVIGILSLLTCSGFVIGAVLGTALGAVALLKASRSPETHGGKGMAIAGIVLSLVSFLGIAVLAAIAIPSLLRARLSANEAMAIGDIRTVISAEAAYQTANAGQYDTPACLHKPSSCIPGYPASGPEFLSTDLMAQDKAGYRRRFVPGLASDEAWRGKVYSASSLKSWAYVAEPSSPGKTGMRAFCGDETGLICSTADGVMPAPSADGHCPSECLPLR